MPTPTTLLARPQRPAIGLLLPLFMAVAACSAEDEHLELRANHDDICTVVPGDIGGGCKGADCPIQHDFVIRCPGSVTARDLQLALDDRRVWASFSVQGQGVHSFLIKGKKLEFVDPLPGMGFAGQANDGTLYRYLDGAAYLRSHDNDSWVQVEVAGLPATFDSDYGVRVRPGADDVLHAAYRIGTRAGSYRLLNLEDGTTTVLGSWDPNVTGSYVSIDNDDRAYSLIGTADWEDGPQVLLRFSHWDPAPIGASGDLGCVASSSRPSSAGDQPPIATLRHIGEDLELLSITDEENWSANTLAGVSQLTDVCPLSFNPVNGECQPPVCNDEAQGFERHAYQLTRTSDGKLWAAYFMSDVEVDMNYSVVNGRCTTSASADGTLHLAELDEQGSVQRLLAMEFDNVGFLPSGRSGRRELAMAAYGSKVAMLLPVQHNRALGDEIAMHVVVVDTAKLE
jgi:hypothetical protein